MAQLKDLLVQGPSRFIGDMVGTNLQIDKIIAKTSASGTEYNIGTNGQALMSNGTNVYWGTVLPYALNAAVGAGTKDHLAIYTASNAIGALSSNIGNGAKPMFLNGGVPTALTSTVGNGMKPVYLSSGEIVALTSTIGTNLKPVYLNGGTITVGAYELKATVNKGSKYGFAYYDGVNSITSIGPGNAGTVLVASGSDNAPSFQVAFGSFTVGSGTNTNKIDITVAGTSKSITLPLVNSSTSAGIYGTDVRFATVKTDGVTELGRYIDLHSAGNTTRDFDVRLDATVSSTARTFTFNQTTGGEFVTHTAATAQGGPLNPVYVNSSGVVTPTSFSISATVGSGTKDHIAIYTTNQAIGASSQTLGSTSKPIYLDSGILKALSASVGNDQKTLVFLNGGAVTASSVTIGATNKPVYLSSGKITVSTSTIGASNQPVYMTGGTITASSSNIGGHNTPIFMQNGVITPSSATIGSQTQFIYMSSGAILPSTTTVGSGIKPIYLNSGALTVSSDTVGTNLKPVYLSSGTITVGAYELKATVDSGTAKGLAYYSDTNTISCESRIFQNRSNRYPLDFTLQNDADNRVAEVWYDAGNATNVTSGSWGFREYSPNSTADTSTTGYFENYYLPTVNTGRTENAAYNILTTKSLITVAQGGTGASTAAGARANLATWAYINDSYPTIIGPDGTTNAWFKIGTANTSYGILPSQSGGIGSGHNYLGTSSWYWQYSYIDEMYGHHLTIQGATSATMSADSTNPRITFSEGSSDTQPVHLIYSDYDSYRAPAGLKVIGGASATPAWFEVEGTIFAGGNAFFANGDGIKVPCQSSSWIDGHNTSQRSIQMANATNTNGYWPWIKQYNSSSGRYWGMGILNTTLYFITSVSSRTANGFDVGWEMRANGTFYAPNLATARYGTGAPSGTYDNGTLYFQYT